MIINNVDNKILFSVWTSETSLYAITVSYIINIMYYVLVGS